jgi:hypothetical protein
VGRGIRLQLNNGAAGHIERLVRCAQVGRLAGGHYVTAGLQTGKREPALVVGRDTLGVVLRSPFRRPYSSVGVGDGAALHAMRVLVIKRDDRAGHGLTGNRVDDLPIDGAVGGRGGPRRRPLGEYGQRNKQNQDSSHRRLLRGCVSGRIVEQKGCCGKGGIARGETGGTFQL